jgi:hypothetical protein
VQINRDPYLRNVRASLFERAPFNSVKRILKKLRKEVVIPCIAPQNVCYFSLLGSDHDSGIVRRSQRIPGVELYEVDRGSAHFSYSTKDAESSAARDQLGQIEL